MDRMDKFDHLHTWLEYEKLWLCINCGKKTLKIDQEEYIENIQGDKI